MINRRDLLSAFVVFLCAPALPAGAASARAVKLLAAARAQIGVTTSYDPAYVKLAFPGGDVPRDRGVCTDVVIRAYRDAFAVDLQALVNADMAKHFARYPKHWGLKKPDRNIDHRRVPNLMVFLARAGASRTVSKTPADYQPGHLVTMLLPGNLPHIALVSDKLSGDGQRPLVIHNIGGGTREEDILFAHAITGHYKFQLA